MACIFFNTKKYIVNMATGYGYTATQKKRKCWTWTYKIVVSLYTIMCDL